MNLTEIGVLGEEWGSDTLINFSANLSQNVTSANAGNLQGNHMFYNNDYMVGCLPVSCLTVNNCDQGPTRCSVCDYLEDGLDKK
jgi:hypothetical protein